MPITDFQRAVLARLEAEPVADLTDSPTVQQIPYLHPQPKAANQYLLAEWKGRLRLFIYDDEVGFEDFTLERQDFATDQSQLDAMVEEIERIRANARAVSQKKSGRTP